MKMTKSRKRFGIMAIEKGFITFEQFMEAMQVQIKEEIDGFDRRLIGEILIELGHMDRSQVDKTISSLEQISEMMEAISEIKRDDD